MIEATTHRHLHCRFPTSGPTRGNFRVERGEQSRDRKGAVISHPKEWPCPSTSGLLHRRRASGYVYFLSTSLLVLAIGLSALMAARIERRTNTWSTDGAAARAHAISAIEIGQAIIAQEVNWRTNRGSSVWLNNIAIGTGHLTLSAAIQSDADANANNNPVIFEGTGYEGEAVQRIRVMLVPATTNGGLVPKWGSWERIGTGLGPFIILDEVTALEAA